MLRKVVCIYLHLRSNRTFMELKLDKVIKGVEDLEF